MLETKRAITINAKYYSNNTLAVTIFSAGFPSLLYDYLKDLSITERKQLYGLVEDVVRNKVLENDRRFKVILKCNSLAHPSIQRKIISAVFKPIEDVSASKLKCQYYVEGDEVHIGKMIPKENLLDKISHNSFGVFGYSVYYDLRCSFVRITKSQDIPEGCSALEEYQIRFKK